MIEFRAKSPPYNSLPWQVLFDFNKRISTDFEFNHCDYKIREEIFTYHSTEFKEAFEKEVLWEKLSNG